MDCQIRRRPHPPRRLRPPHHIRRRPLPRHGRALRLAALQPHRLLGRHMARRRVPVLKARAGVGAGDGVQEGCESVEGGDAGVCGEAFWGCEGGGGEGDGGAVVL